MFGIVVISILSDSILYSFGSLVHFIFSNRISNTCSLGNLNSVFLTHLCDTSLSKVPMTETFAVNLLSLSGEFHIALRKKQNSIYNLKNIKIVATTMLYLPPLICFHIQSKSLFTVMLKKASNSATPLISRAFRAVLFLPR